MGSTGCVVSAPAKVNLYLGVAGLRQDGYHSVTTVLQALELADELEITPAGRLSVDCEPPLDIPVQDNLVYRAAVALGEVLGRDPAFAIHLTKRIPAGAGLGGGSSDAAATLAGMAHLWGLDPNDPCLLRVASRLGADVPFFLNGGAALYGGRGEKLVRNLPTVPFEVAIVKPESPVATAAAYAAFDRLDRSPAPGPSRVTDALRRQERASLASALYNNMLDAASGLVVEIADALALCRDSRGVLGATLAGSGSAVFALCEDARAAEDVVARATERGWWSVATRTRASGVVVRQAEGSS